MKSFKFIGLFTLLIGLTSFGITNAVTTTLPTETSSSSDYVYRFWSDAFHGHFFTIDFNEASQVKDYDSNWGYEKVAYSAFSTQEDDTIPLYRFWSDVFHGHFYTADQTEYLKVKDTDENWNYEWVAYYL